MNELTGSLSPNLPSSCSIIAATEVTGLVIEYSRHTVSASAGSASVLSSLIASPFLSILHTAS